MVLEEGKRGDEEQGKGRTEAISDTRRARCWWKYVSEAGPLGPWFEDVRGAEGLDILGVWIWSRGEDTSYGDVRDENGAVAFPAEKELDAKSHHANILQTSLIAAETVQLANFFWSSSLFFKSCTMH